MTWDKDSKWKLIEELQSIHRNGQILEVELRFARKDDRADQVWSENVRLAQEIIRRAVDAIPAQRSCSCGAALAHAVITERAAVTPEARERLGLLLGKYWQ